MLLNFGLWSVASSSLCFARVDDQMVRRIVVDVKVFIHNREWEELRRLKAGNGNLEEHSMRYLTF